MECDLNKTETLTFNCLLLQLLAAEAERVKDFGGTLGSCMETAEQIMTVNQD
jgi:hypothetical protein